MDNKKCRIYAACGVSQTPNRKIRKNEEKKMQVTILGIKKTSYKGKDGSDKTGYNYSCMKDYTEYEKDNADCRGLDVIREYSSKEYPVQVGDVVNLIYEPGFGGKATLVDMQVVKISTTSFDKKGDK